MTSNRMTLAGIFIAPLVVGALIGIYALPKKVVENEEKKAASKVAPEATQDAARKVAEDEIRKAATEISSRLLADQHKREIAPSVELSSEAPVVIDRKAFTMTLPQGSEVDPPKPKIDREKLVHFRLPGHASGSVVVVDNKGEANG